MFKLAHISDVHLSPLPDVKIRQLIGKRITGYVNWKRNRKSSLGTSTLDKIIHHMQSQSPDHIAVTGDLTNLSLPTEFENAGHFLTSLGAEETVSTLCGNHDAYVPGALQKAIDRWQPWLSSDHEPTHTVNDFPFLRIRQNIALIGCNSAEATLPFMATGYFRHEQAERLGRLLEQTKGLYRIVIIHHPPLHQATPSYKRLIGIDLFQQTIKNHGAELILHGHTHLATKTKISGKNHDVPVICVPAAGQNVGGHKPPARYNLFKISKTKSNWEVEHQAFGLDHTGNAIIKVVSEAL